MILTTTSTIEGYVIECYRGLVSGVAAADLDCPSIREGRAYALEDMCKQAKAEGANAVIGIHTAVSAFSDGEVRGSYGTRDSVTYSGSIIYVSGTAVRIERLKGGEGEHAHRKP